MFRSNLELFNPVAKPGVVGGHHGIDGGLFCLTSLKFCVYDWATSKEDRKSGRGGDGRKKEIRMGLLTNKK